MIYFDNAASTRPSEEVIENMAEMMRKRYANPAAQSSAGFESEKIIRSAAKTLADIINARPDEIYFTSGGTEGDNWALFGTALLSKKKHIVVSAVEHHAILNTALQLEKLGYEVSYAPCDKYGTVSPEAVKSVLRDDTFLI